MEKGKFYENNQEFWRNKNELLIVRNLVEDGLEGHFWVGSECENMWFANAQHYNSNHCRNLLTKCNSFNCFGDGSQQIQCFPNEINIKKNYDGWERQVGSE